MATRKRKNRIKLDPQHLVKQSIIGCTVMPSKDDPELSGGIALTTLSAFDLE